MQNPLRKASRQLALLRYRQLSRRSQCSLVVLPPVGQHCTAAHSRYMQTAGQHTAGQHWPLSSHLLQPPQSLSPSASAGHAWDSMPGRLQPVLVRGLEQVAAVHQQAAAGKLSTDGELLSRAGACLLCLFAWLCLPLCMRQTAVWAARRPCSFASVMGSCRRLQMPQRGLLGFSSCLFPCPLRMSLCAPACQLMASNLSGLCSSKSASSGAALQFYAQVVT